MHRKSPVYSCFDFVEKIQWVRIVRLIFSMWGVGMKRLVLFICLVAMVSGVRAATEYRDFTSAEGKTIRACILAYDAPNEIVAVERENRGSSKVPITVFSEDDQEYIKRWNNQNSIKSTTKFKISCDRRSINDWTEEKMGTIRYTSGSEVHNQVIGKQFFKETGYEIIFANRNNHAVTGLILEYCIYYEQEVRTDKNLQQGILFGSVAIDKLTQSERKNIQTDSVVTFKDMSDSSFINARVLKGEVHGISMRLYLQEGDEKTLIREMAVPDSVTANHEWSSQSSPVGYNK